MAKVLKQTQKTLIERRMLKMVGGLLGIVLMICLVYISYYWIKSPGKMIQYTDENGNVLENSIASKEYIEINGTKLGMIIKSRNLSNPILLFLHGGVGMPDYPMTWEYPSDIEDHFTVVWIEQRCAGLSFDSNIKPEEITTEQSVSDAIEVSKYLCKRFNTEKLYLMGMSGGTYTGLRAISKAPELYYAYIGMSQIVDHYKSREAAYNYMINYFTDKGQLNKVKKLENAYGKPGYGKVELPLMCEAGIETFREMKSQYDGIYLPVMESPEYTLGEKINIWRGLILNKKSPLSDDASSSRIDELNTKFEVPIYFLSGKYDYICASEVVKEYFDRIEAPIKGYYLFEESAHSPLFEEPDQVVAVLEKDVKQGKNELSLY